MMSGVAKHCDMEALPRRRIDAIKAGSSRYYTGIRCHAGHVTWRNTASGACNDCGAEKRKRFAAKYRPVVAACQRAYRARTKEEKLQRRRALYEQKTRQDPIARWVTAAVSASKARAKKKGMPHNLTHEYVRSLCVERCPALGVTLTYSNPERQVATSPNLDRIKPALGYVVGNVRVISKRANTIRNDATTEEFGMIYRWLLAEEDN